MSITVYDLAGKDDRRFSPYCWRVRMALAHKGLAAEFRPWHFTAKDEIAFSGQGRVPVMVDGERTVADSWAIACDLEERYPERPSLFGGTTARTLARFVNHFVDTVAHPGLLRMVVADIFAQLEPIDQPYFRKSREERFGAKLEDVQARRDERLPGWRAALEPIRAQLRDYPFMAGVLPAYADYIVGGMFGWARGVSPYALLAREDPIFAWRERVMALHGGLALKLPGYPLAA
ncbi:MAG: glutathione S-transferase family protein [Alphaproteobacteria bacterium]